MLGGLAAGLAFRLFVDPPDQRTFGLFLRSGLHGAGVALAIWTVNAVFAIGVRSKLGSTLRRLPVAIEVLFRAIVLTAALVVVGLTLQFLLYVDLYGLHWLTADWLKLQLPAIVLLGFGLSLGIGIVVELLRLIGAPLLASALLGTYHRPRRQNLIVMFLDLAGSTRLAETLGELRVHDLITRFFFDIDGPILDLGGRVLSYVGDEAIIGWPISADPVRNARGVSCFFAVEREIANLSGGYKSAFGVAPAFRAGIHAGVVIVSECGDAKRQLAYFGDTMNVGARLCERCKAVNAQLVISGELLRIMKVPADLAVSDGERVIVRGREAPIAAYVVEKRQPGQ